MQRLVSSDNYNLAMLDFYKKVVPNQKADEAFQANKYTRWSEEQSASYMTSTACGMAVSKFILCDIEKCLESAIQDERPSDIEYFKNWLAMGAKYLNLDSNNRCINVTNFYKNLTNSFTYFIEDEALLNTSGSFCYLFIPAFYENMIDVDFKDLISK